jgi:hypothetical protein
LASDRQSEGGGVREIEADYLVVGAGTSGMAFADELVRATDAEVVLVDRRHAPGGHWLDAYPFVRLHQPSAFYGVGSRTLGHDRVDETGPNAGFYERATAAEICDYFSAVLEQELLPTGRVRWLGLHDVRADGDVHLARSLLTGEETTIRVRRRVVDATYTESSIPSRHTPPFEVGEGARMVPPNGLVDLDAPAGGFTVLGAGKTGSDTVSWLLDAGVDPDRITWVRPRDPWLFDRAMIQPLDQVGGYMTLQARWVEAAATSQDGTAFAHALEDAGVFLRIDQRVEPRLYRGATISRAEVEALATVERVVRGKVSRIDPGRMVVDGAEVVTDPGTLFVDCTAAGVPSPAMRPVFEPGRITLQYVTLGFVPWSAATIGFVEAQPTDDAAKNALCPPLRFTGDIADVLQMADIGMRGLFARSSDPVVNAWNDQTRLNPARGVSDHLDDPRVLEGLESLGANFGAALANLARLAPAAPA